MSEIKILSVGNSFGRYNGKISWYINANGYYKFKFANLYRGGYFINRHYYNCLLFFYVV